ncbi:MAG TPA: phosphotransferase, partial [Acidimicrobiales bacterium]|nr:phosphotransferase [Acidimicrobiales bacterium]
MGDLGFPASPDHLGPDWYTEALRSRGALGDATAVATAEASPIGVGVGILSLLWRVMFTYDNGSGPATAVLKLPHTVEGARHTADAFSFYGREVNFYREAAERTPLGTPAVYAAEYDEGTKDFVLLLQDLGDRRQIDQLDGCSVDDALVAAKELASHHAWWWQDADIINAPWTFRTCDPPNPQALPPTLRQSWPLIESEFPHLLPGPMLDAARRMPDACGELLERLSEPPLTLIHGDYRLDNLFFDEGAEDPVVAIDWQICGLGRSPYDIAYFMSQSLTKEDRKAADEQVVRAYHDALRAGGVEDYSYDQCFDDYRLAILFCSVYPLNAGALDLVNDRARALFETMLDRSASAILDLDAL